MIEKEKKQRWKIQDKKGIFKNNNNNNNIIIIQSINEHQTHTLNIYTLISI
jgi:hypothetical protein